MNIYAKYYFLEIIMTDRSHYIDYEKKKIYRYAVKYISSAPLINGVVNTV